MVEAPYAVQLGFKWELEKENHQLGIRTRKWHAGCIKKKHTKTYFIEKDAAMVEQGSSKDTSNNSLLYMLYKGSKLAG